MRLTALLLGAILLSVGGARAQRPAQFDQDVAEGTSAMYRLQYGSARAIFERIVAEHPESPVGYGMLSILSWNELLYAASNPALHEYGTPTPYSSRRIHKPIERQTARFHEANDRLLAVCEQILAKDPANVVALYFQGLAYENLAAEALTISRDRWDAVGPGRRANSIHERVLNLDPGFVDARVSVGAYKYALATVPAFAKAILLVPRLFGFLRGDKDEAFALIESVGESGTYRRLDARIMLSVMLAFQGDPRRAAAILDELRRLYPENYLLDLHLAAVQALNLQDPRAALATYQALLGALPRKAPGLGAGEVHLRMGKTYLGLGDHARARAAFESALDSTAVEAETKPLGYWYLASVFEKLGSPDRARDSYRAMLDLAGGMDSLANETAVARARLR
jgi:tetratricopeptide (TPR) repeat protein